MPRHPLLYPHLSSMFYVILETIKTLDIFYANSKEAYISAPLLPMGKSDHNLVYLQPVYKPLVCRQPAVSRTVRKWSDETNEALKDCFETTMWEELCNNHDNHERILTI